MDWWRTESGQRIRRYMGVITLELIIIAVLLAVINRPEREPAPDTEGPSGTYEPLVLYASVDAHATDAEPVTTYYDVPLDTDVQNELFKRCEEYGLDVALVLAVIEIESGFDADAISETGDYGLMQINASNFEWLAEAFGDMYYDFLDPASNIRAGCYVLWLAMLSADGDTEKALMAYNMGTAGAMELWAEGVTSTEYTEKVMEAMEGYA